MSAIADFFELRMGLVFFGIAVVLMLSGTLGIEKQVELKKIGAVLSRDQG